MEKLFIGLDFGSDSVRALLVDRKGRELNCAVHNYRRWQEQLYCNAATGMFRQHPQDHLEGLETVIKAVIKGYDPSAVAGISLDSTASTPVAVDAQCKPLALYEKFADNPNAMFMLWKDHSALAEENRINCVAGNWHTDYRKYSGGSYSCEWFWSKLLYILRNDESIRRHIVSFVEHCDWVAGVLTGCNDPAKLLRSRCTAGHKAMWHAEWNGLPPEDFLQTVDPLLSGMRSKLYNDSFVAGTFAGTLTGEWAQRLGLTERTVIGVGGIDCHICAVGAGIMPGEMVKVLGTSTCDILAADDPHFCVKGICGQVDGSVLPGMTGFEAGQAAFGDIFNWFKNFLGYAGKVDLAQLERDAAGLPAGAGGVMALDWFNGRRTPYADSHLTGLLGNLHLGVTPPMVYRALVESAVMGSKAIFEHYKKSNIEIKGITAVGGISYKSNLVMQMLADAFYMPIKVAATQQAGALGSAMIAAAAAGEYPSVCAASQAMNGGIHQVYQPDPQRAAEYEALYKQYCSLGRSWTDFLCR